MAMGLSIKYIGKFQAKGHIGLVGKHQNVYTLYILYNV